MWSARRSPAGVSGPVPRTNDIDTDERRQKISQRGRPTTAGVDKRCLIWRPVGQGGAEALDRAHRSEGSRRAHEPHRAGRSVLRVRQPTFSTVGIEHVPEVYRRRLETSPGRVEFDIADLTVREFGDLGVA